MTLARWSLRRNNGANTDYRKTCRNRAASVRQFPSIFFSKFAAENPPSTRQTAPHPGHSELSPPLLMVPLSSLLPRGSSMGRCNRQRWG
ncbi:hypothetical protein CPAR01_02256 [Colletotrichum paranaense]|uniref:Uncharacterized protein n=1 Tax=Colletotrichum paranaense TaxID=1914294 RepID=A0ABQ9SZ39_9PEZI|nr:uncharacterized protein CPAR01_02256 [Colletotrichum paranaense]KAK1544754.1 hypothetical protein CPAR01_02256 [Colletotrichum paranaense]